MASGEEKFESTITRRERAFFVPDEFPDILRNFTREVLRDFPHACPEDDAAAWILSYGETFFKGNRLRGKRKDASKMIAERHAKYGLSTVEVMEKLKASFEASDRDANGRLDRREFKEMLTKTIGKLGLPSEVIKSFAAEADMNSDGYIDYNEFLPLAMSAYDSLRIMDRFNRVGMERERKTQAMVKGVSREQYEAELREVFAEADEDKSGRLSRAEFASVLQRFRLGFTREEINVIMLEIDSSDDGEIDVEEFMSKQEMFIKGMAWDHVADMDAPGAEKVYLERLTAKLKQADPESSGLVAFSTFQGIVTDVGYFLNPLEVAALMARVDDDLTPDEKIVYMSVIDEVALFLMATKRVQSDEVKADKLLRARQVELAEVAGKSKHEFDAILLKALEPLHDTSEFRVPVVDIQKALETMPIELTKVQVSAIIRAVKGQDNRGDVRIVQRDAFACIQLCAEQSLLMMEV